MQTSPVSKLKCFDSTRTERYLNQWKADKCGQDSASDAHEVPATDAVALSLPLLPLLPVAVGTHISAAAAMRRD